MNGKTIIKIAKKIIKNKGGSVIIDNKSNKKHNLIFIDPQGDTDPEKTLKKLFKTK